MTTETSQRISLNAHYDFEFSSERPAITAEFGWEFHQGEVKLPDLDRLFPKHRVSFFPILTAGVTQAVLIQQLEKNFSYFSKKTDARILIDWPEELQGQLPLIQKTFPKCVSLVPEKTFQTRKYAPLKGSLLNQLQNEPLLFLESLDSRRLILKYLNPAQVHCMGGLEAFLQYQLHCKQTQHLRSDDFLFQNGVLPWLTAGFHAFPYLNSSPFLHDKQLGFTRNILQFIRKNPMQPILIVCGFSHLNFLQHQLSLLHSEEECQNFAEEKIILFDQAREKRQRQYHLTQTSPQASLEYAQVNGSVSRYLCTAAALTNGIDAYEEGVQQGFLQAKKNYTDWTKMPLEPYHQRDFLRFAYRLAKDNGHLLPDSFSLLLSARSVVDSNFAFELLKELQTYPAHKEFDAALPTIDLPLQSFLKNTHQISLQRFQTIQSQAISKKPKLNTVQKQNLVKKTEPISEEKYADNRWVHEDHPYSCSFPKEDIFMEKLAADIKSNMQERIRGAEVTHKELTSDFADGLDLRETIRQWHKQKLLVKETRQTGKADIGTVVFSFAAPTDEERYSWKAFWLAEQHDDSHLMFFATPFQDQLIGPGIAKSEFGGFAVIPLRSYLEHPWHHPFILHHAQSAVDCLLLAGALSNDHKSILFISNHPPSQHILKILKQSGKNVVYTRLDDFSAEDIKHVRTFHILAEAGVRNYAQKYIRKE